MEDNEIEFPLNEEDDYPSLCVGYIYLLEEENVGDKLYDILHDELQAIVNHLLEDEIIEN